MEWHKELPYNKGFYKQFHLSSDAYGCIHCNRYYIVELMHAEKSYGIYIPSYDISILEHLTRQKHKKTNIFKATRDSKRASVPVPGWRSNQSLEQHHIHELLHLFVFPKPLI